MFHPTGSAAAVKEFQAASAVYSEGDDEAIIKFIQENEWVIGIIHNSLAKPYASSVHEFPIQ